MSIITKSARLQRWLARHPKMREWLWFAALWMAGLTSVMAIAYPIRLVIKNIG